VGEKKGAKLVKYTKTYLGWIIGFVEVCICCVDGVQAGEWCIAPGNVFNGNGTSWSPAAVEGGEGAFNAIPQSLIRGDTYYFADGTMKITGVVGYECKTPAEGTKTIALIKAVQTSHGPAMGWVDSMGDGQTVFISSSADSPYSALFCFTTPYWRINGSIGDRLKR
jgi:hypothetical protein